MTQSQRQSLRARFNFQCGYCGVSETQSAATLTVDHFQPTSREGRDDETNWVYACSACNTFKSAYWTESEELQLLHPGSDNFQDHWSENVDGFLVSSTSRGQNHIEKLHLNRPELVAHRLTLRVDEERDRIIEELSRELTEIRREMDEINARMPQ